MKYYISWSHSDPIYHQYLNGVRILVSPPNVSLAWKVRDWPRLPDALIIDSGAFQYSRKGRTATPDAVLLRQLEMIQGLTIPTALCHLDVPMLGTRSLPELDRRITHSLENARWLMDYILEYGLPSHIRPVGVIQGYTTERVYTVAQALADMGYTSFALGSLATMVVNAKDEVFRRVEAALEAIGPNLHVLGISSVTVLSKLATFGVQSADSGTPIHEAWRGGVFYSSPFRRYKVASPHFKEWRRSYSFAELLTEPLSCDCPVCQEDSSRILQPRGKTFVNLRAIHNYYHLARELAATVP